MPIMFDPSRYVPDMSGMALQGNKLAVESAMGATQNSRENLQLMAELQQRRSRAAQELMIARAQMAEREAARKELGQRFDQRLGLQRQQMANQQSNLMYERGQRQQATDADLVAGLVGPLSSGNLNAMDAARAQALARDPSLSIQLPGEKAPSPEGIPSVDDAYPEDLNKVRVSRGGKEVYTSQDAADARRREAMIASNLVAPFAGDPWAETALNAAGAGVTGEKAAEIGRGGYEKREGREAAERAAGVRIAASRDLSNKRAEEENTYKLHDRVEKMAAVYAPQVRKIDENDRAFSLAERQLGEDANAFMQNKALAGILKAYTGAAATDAERRQDKEAAGKWNYYDQLINRWIGGGELPPDFQQQVLSMVQDARHESVVQRHQLGLRARDHVYASTSLPVRSPRELAEFGNQAYSAVTGQSLTAEQLDAEAKRIAPDFERRRRGRPMAGGGGEMLPDDALVPHDTTGADLSGYEQGSGARDRLPVTGKPPPIPVQPPSGGGGDAELDDMLKQMEQQYAP